MSLWIAIFPFDVIKSRVQISNTSEPMLKMLVSIARTEGTYSRASILAIGILWKTNLFIIVL